LYQNNGKVLSVLADITFDFIFSMAVFHHIPSRKVIEDNIRGVGEHLHPGACSNSRRKAAYRSSN
jgi:hypothetical protein